MTDLQFPIGKFRRPDAVSDSDFLSAVDSLAALPAAMHRAVDGLTAAQLDTAYRPGGWTVRQVVHHVPDSHAQAYARCKLALTEDVPTIKPYDEARWAELPDVTVTPVDSSLTLLDALHTRWVGLLRGIPTADRARTFRHPESGVWRLDTVALLYAWHGQHHLSHITQLRERSGWR
jgi:DinB superfamily